MHWNNILSVMTNQRVSWAVSTSLQSLAHANARDLSTLRMKINEQNVTMFFLLFHCSFHSTFFHPSRVGDGDDGHFTTQFHSLYGVIQRSSRGVWVSSLVLPSFRRCLQLAKSIPSCLCPSNSPNSTPASHRVTLPVTKLGHLIRRMDKRRSSALADCIQ